MATDVRSHGNYFLGADCVSFSRGDKDSHAPFIALQQVCIIQFCQPSDETIPSHSFSSSALWSFTRIDVSW
ncbi:hypothetical protein NC651_028491 [Populus alba x Populus x berolinensis]|nr:hypothetical protein NC651_028491 [Populus alba x Populus x berolinensis]